MLSGLDGGVVEAVLLRGRQHQATVTILPKAATFSAAAATTTTTTSTTRTSLAVTFGR